MAPLRLCPRSRSSTPPAPTRQCLTETLPATPSVTDWGACDGDDGRRVPRVYRLLGHWPPEGANRSASKASARAAERAPADLGRRIVATCQRPDPPRAPRWSPGRRLAGGGTRSSSLARDGRPPEGRSLVVTAGV